MIRWLVICAITALPLPIAAGEVSVVPGGLADAIAEATDGDVLRLTPGDYAGPVLLDKALTLDGGGHAAIRGNETGSVITVTAEDVHIRGLRITGSGSDHETIDSGIQLTKTAHRAIIEANTLVGNLYGIDVHGAKDARVTGNVIEGRQDSQMNRRGNGIYVWNAPGAQVIGNRVRWGRDGIFVNSSKRNVFSENQFRDLRFAVHYMYADDTEVSNNLSVGNHLGFAVMFSTRVRVTGNVSIDDRDHGVMLNYANNSVISGNLVQGGPEKCVFLYNS
ncbi:MAG: right-handed parallel beta-helix repeat-containing protein, partial [Silicimonas sp.]|nr:right-handed parallel beta-helix repeat-containing protein [Silicimonas sp.]